MAYEPKTWECGEVVTAEALNNIEQGIADASSGGGVQPSFVKIMEDVQLSFIQNTGNCSGGGAFYNGATLGNLIGDKHIIGFVAEKNSGDGLMTAMVSCDRGDRVFVNPMLHRDATLNASGGSVLVNSNDTLNGEKVNVYAICI